MRKFRLKAMHLYLVLAVFFVCACSNAPEKVYKYKIEYGGFTGGWYNTNEYKVENGYYIFECGKDSIKLKETLVDAIITNNNYR
jgi:hypothetical protein